MADSAKAILESTLADYGLSSLGTFAWNEYLAGVDVNQIMLDIRQTPEYKQRFPAMQTLANRGQALTESQYINYEQSAAAVFKQAGLPEGFYDSPDDFAGFLTNNVALPELQDRVKMAQVAVYQFHPEDLQALDDFYHINGMGGNLIGDLTAWAIDPNRAEPLIQKQFAAVQTSGIAARTGYGQLQKTEAEHLAEPGITPDQAQQGFGTLANYQQLFTNLPGETPNAPTREQGQGAIFEQNAADAKAISDQQARRQAAFQQGGGYAQTQAGTTGLR